jgi:hypothetical protein
LGPLFPEFPHGLVRNQSCLATFDASHSSQVVGRIIPERFDRYICRRDEVFMSIPIRSAGEITKPGDYHLANDITVPSGKGLWCSLPDAVNIDLNGRTLRCTEPGNALSMGIEQTGAGPIQVFNGTITGFRFGIDCHATAVVRDLDFSGTKYVAAHLRGANSQALHNICNGMGGVTDEAYAIVINMLGGGGLVRGNHLRNIYRQTGAPASLAGEGVPIVIHSGAGSCVVERNILRNDQPELSTIGAYLGTGAAHEFNDNWVVGFGTAVWGGRQPTGPMYARRNGLWMPWTLAGSRGVYGNHGLFDPTNLVVGFATGIDGTIPPTTSSPVS